MAYTGPENYWGSWENGRFTGTVTGGGRTVQMRDGQVVTDGGNRTTSRREDDDDDRGSSEAAASVRSLLRQFGLEQLFSYADQIARGRLTWEELEVQLYDPTTRPGKVVDELYPELRLLRDNDREPMSIAQIQEYRSNARSLMQSAGMPEGFYDDPSDFTDFIVKGVDLPELNERVQGFKTAAYEAPVEYVAEMERIYGIGRDDLAAYWMDEEKALPLLQKRALAASTSAAAVRAGFGGLTADEAERLATVGVTGDQAVERFGTLVEGAEMWNQLPGSGEDSFSRGDQLDLLAGDTNQQVRARRRAETRAAETAGGGGFAASQAGFSGFGSSR